MSQDKHDREPVEVERVQTGVRLEKRMLKVLKAIAEQKDMSLGDLLEGIVLHAFEGKVPFSQQTLKEIEQFKTLYGMTLKATDSHNLKEKGEETMRSLALLACAGSLAVSALGASAGAQEAAPEKLLHASTSFSLIVHAPYAKAAPLFGPEGERAWAGKHWDPQFIHPQSAHDEQGAVFTIAHGDVKAVWVNTLFDVEGRHFQYVYFLPDLLVTTIDVHFRVISANETGVNVVYTRTALTTEGNDHVQAMTEGDQKAAPEWQAAIDHLLAANNGPGQR